MASPRTPNQKKAYAALKSRLNQYSYMVQSVYDTLNTEAAKLAVSTGYDGEGEFRWSDYPKTRKRIDDIQGRFCDDISGLVYAGTEKEWMESNIVQDMLAAKAMKTYHVESKGNRYQKLYHQTNLDALQAFQERVEGGMNLSSKVWNQSVAYRRELECAISAGVEKGMSAVTLSKRLSQYLTDFDQLKADYKEKYGKAVDCLNCEYRSMRLARTEINMSYRAAEQKRWQQFDFVLGYEIKLSGSHPVTDICDELQGRYPKEFKFSGWHPNCMCYCIPILKTEEQFWADEDKATPTTEQPDYPKPVTDWMKENEAKISDAREMGTLPYFFRDNDETLVRAMYDRSGSLPVGYVEVFADRKYMKEESGRFRRYGTRAETRRQVAQWEQLSAKMDAIEEEFDSACRRTISKTKDTLYTGISRKTRGSALRKADDIYGGDLSQIEDLIRCNFCCRSDQYLKVVESVRKGMPVYKDLSTRQYMNLQRADAYVCRFMNVAYGDIKGEILVTPVEMVAGRESAEMTEKYLGKTLYKKIKAKADAEGIQLHQGHKLYERQRAARTEAEKKAIYQEMQSYYGSMAKLDPYANGKKVVTVSDAKLMRDIGMKVGSELDAIANNIAKSHGGRCTPLNMKSEESIVRKSKTDNLTPYQLKDVVRTTIIVPPSEVEACCKELQNTPGFMRYKAQTGDKFYGYSGNIINIEMSNGVVAEIQVNTPSMIFAKESEEAARDILGDKVWEQIHRLSGMPGGLGHKYYDKIRKLDLVKDKKKIEELAAKSEEYYSHFRTEYTSMSNKKSVNPRKVK